MLSNTLTEIKEIQSYLVETLQQLRQEQQTKEEYMQKLIESKAQLKEKDDQTKIAQTQLMETTQEQLWQAEIENKENLQKLIEMKKQMIRKETQIADLNHKLLTPQLEIRKQL